MSAAGQPPLVSVVVPTWRSARLLPGGLQSLAAQTMRDFEVLVSDGGSDDGTLEVARAAAPRLPALRIDSRPDDGVYDAINRAIPLTRGAWVLVLGSDDRLHAPDTLEHMAVALRRSRADVVHGDVRVMSAGSSLGSLAGGRYGGPTALGRLLKDNVCQQAIFYRRSLFDRIGLFHPRYRVWADWEFNLRAVLEKDFEWVDLVVTDYHALGFSNDRVDEVLSEELPEILRSAAMARPFDPRLKPLHRALLRQADTLRRRGRLRDAFLYLGSWARIQWQHFGRRTQQSEQAGSRL